MIEDLGEELHFDDFSPALSGGPPCVEDLEGTFKVGHAPFVGCSVRGTVGDLSSKVAGVAGGLGNFDGHLLGGPVPRPEGEDGGRAVRVIGVLDAYSLHLGKRNGHAREETESGDAIRFTLLGNRVVG